jgi:hypothetical protein
MTETRTISKYTATSEATTINRPRSIVVTHELTATPEDSLAQHAGRATSGAAHSARAGPPRAVSRRPNVRPAVWQDLAGRGENRRTLSSSTIGIGHRDPPRRADVGRRLSEKSASGSRNGLPRSMPRAFAKCWCIHAYRDLPQATDPIEKGHEATSNPQRPIAQAHRRVSHGFGCFRGQRRRRPVVRCRVKEPWTDQPMGGKCEQETFLHRSRMTGLQR